MFKNVLTFVDTPKETMHIDKKHSPYMIHVYDSTQQLKDQFHYGMHPSRVERYCKLYLPS